MTTCLVFFVKYLTYSSGCTELYLSVDLPNFWVLPLNCHSKKSQNPKFTLFCNFATLTKVMMRNDDDGDDDSDDDDADKGDDCIGYWWWATRQAADSPTQIFHCMMRMMMVMAMMAMVLMTMVMIVKMMILMVIRTVFLKPRH